MAIGLWRKPAENTDANEASTNAIEMNAAKKEKRTNLKCVCLGRILTSGQTIEESSDRQLFRPRPAEPKRDQHLRDECGRDHRGDAADRERPGEALHRPCAELEENERGAQLGDVAVDDGDHG